MTAMRGLPLGLLDLDDPTRRAVSIAFTIVALAASIVGLLTSSLVLDDLGLASGLSFLYWFGLVALVVASLVEASRGERANRALMIGQIAAWTLLVWITPTILEGTPRFRTSYSNYGYVDPLVRGDGFDLTRFLYHNWPLFPILMAGLRLIGISAEALMIGFPIVAIATYVGLAALLLAVLAGRRDEPAAEADPPDLRTRLRGLVWTLDARLLLVLFLFPVFNWTGQDYFSPQGLAFALFLGFIIVLANAARAPSGRLGGVATIATLVLFLAIVATHVLTSLFALGVLGVLVLTRRLKPWTVFVTAAVLFFTWQVYVAAPFYDSYGDRLLEGMLRLGSFFETNVSNRVGGSPGHILAAQLRIVATTIVFGLGGLAIILLWRRRSFGRSVWFAAAYLAGITAVIPISIYGGEAVIRGLLFSLPILPVIIALAMDRQAMRVAVAVALVVGAPLHIYTHYGNEAYDYVSAAEVELFDEVAELAPANIYGGYPAGAYLETAHLESRNASLPRQEAATTVDDFLVPEDHHWADAELPTYVVLTEGDKAAVRLFRHEPALIDDVRAALDASEDFVVVFENEAGTIYGRAEGFDRSDSGGAGP